VSWIIRTQGSASGTTAAACGEIAVELTRAGAESGCSARRRSRRQVRLPAQPRRFLPAQGQGRWRSAQGSEAPWRRNRFALQARLARDGPSTGRLGVTLGHLEPASWALDSVSLSGLSAGGTVRRASDLQQGGRRPWPELRSTGCSRLPLRLRRAAQYHLLSPRQGFQHGAESSSEGCTQGAGYRG